ncbi:MAG: hypothetical protein AAGB46_01215 [Verrucomicrobiota bacterium]
MNNTTKIPLEIAILRGSSKRAFCKILCLLATFQIGAGVQAQSEETGASDSSDVFELSPFEVDGSRDQGYRAENTLSGSRMNMSLDDVAQSVTVLTADFLEDVGAESVEDILLYSINAESYYEEDKLDSEDQVGSEISFNPNGRRDIRGQTASVTVDYMGGGGSVDTYNTSRAEISQGPNAILFGFGGSGGLINLTTQTANMRRDSYLLESTVGSDGKFRNVLNINKSLIDDKLGFRAISLLDDAEGWREDVWNEQRRNTFVLSYNPFEGTTINASYENAHRDSSFSVNQGATDGYTEWTEARLSEDYLARYDTGDYASFNRSRGANNANLNANGLNRGNNARRLIYIDNLDFAAAGLPTDAGNILPVTHNPNSQPLVSNRMFSEEEIDLSQFTPFGENSFRTENIKNLKLSLSQRIAPNMYFNVSFFDSQNSAFDRSPNGRGLSVKADVVKVYDGIANASPFDGIENPFGPSGENFWLYSEQTQVRKTSTIDNKVLRGTWGYRVDSDRFGTHQFGISTFQKEWERSIIKDREIIDIYTADEAGVDLAAYNLNFQANNGRNRVWRRHYYQVGPDGLPLDDSDIGTGNIDDPVSLLVEDGEGNPLELGTLWVANDAAGRRRVTNDVDGYTLSMVNKLFNNRLTTTFGYRSNDLVSNLYNGTRANSAVLEDENGDPILNADGSFALSDLAAADYIVTNLDGSLASSNASQYYVPTVATRDTSFTAENKTFGAVYRLTDWMSLTYNQGDNRSEPDFFVLILPDARLGPGNTGKSQDIGVRFNLFERKVSLNFNYFDSSQKNVRNQGRIGEVLLEPHRALWRTFENVQSDLGFVESDPRHISEEEFETRNATGVNSTLMDKDSRGFDARLVANFTKNWKMVFNFSKTVDFGRSKLYDNDREWIADQTAAASALYDAYVAAGDGSDEAFRSAFNLEEFDELNELFLVDADRIQYEDLLESDPEAASAFLLEKNPIERTYAYANQEIDVVKIEVEDIGTGVSPLKANMFTSYRFSEGRLKGLSIGGGFNWKDGRVLNRFFNYTNAEGETETYRTPQLELGDFDSTTEYVSGDDLRTNLMLAYSMKTKLFGSGNHRLKFQLNVNNIFADDYQLEPLRYTSEGVIRKYQIISPRSWKFKTSIEF